jgi:hypothetical protein
MTFLLPFQRSTKMHIRTPFCVVFSLLLLCTSGLAQTQPAANQPVTVTVTATARQVRYAALGEVYQTRVRVFAPGGLQVFDSDFRLGNVIDWPLQDQQGSRIADGSYLFLVTVKEFSGKLSQKYGSTQVETDQVLLERTDRADLSAAQAAALESNRQGEPVSLVDRLGAAVSGTANEVSAKKTADKTDKSAASNGSDVTPAVSGTGTAGQLTKWLDTAGTLVDSSLSESGSNLLPAGNLVFKNNFGPIFRNTSGQGFNQVFVDANNNLSFFVNNTTRMNLAPGGNLDLLGGNMTFANNFGPVFKNTAGSGNNQVFVDANNNLSFFVNNTTRMNLAPGGNLDLLGGNMTFANNFGPVFKNTAGSGNNQIFLDGNNSLSFFIAGASRMTLAPGGNLNLLSGNMTFGNNFGPVFKNPSGAGTSQLFVDANNNLSFFHNNAVRVTIAASGDVAMPGSLAVSGNIAAKYQDVAEWVSASEKLTAGTVVVLDATKNNAVTASRQAYDTAVAGVISAQPGIVLGQSGEGRVMVATTGRVKVKVDASKHPIHVGDLLVTSGQSGVAMKSMPIRFGRRLIHQPGTIIGKALEPLPRGHGEILTLLSLQ